jgi:hypothetical protein
MQGLRLGELQFQDILGKTSLQDLHLNKPMQLQPSDFPQYALEKR